MYLGQAAPSITGIVKRTLIPIKLIKRGDVISPRIEKKIANRPVIICPFNSPIKPRIKASGDRTNERAKIPTKPTITPQSPQRV